MCADKLINVRNTAPQSEQSRFGLVSLCLARVAGAPVVLARFVLARFSVGSASSWGNGSAVSRVFCIDLFLVVGAMVQWSQYGA